MKSQNFEFLRSRRAVLADLGGFAELYAHDDPASSLLKQRGFVEHAVSAIYERYHLEPPYSDNLNDLMSTDAFRLSVPEVVQNKLHTIRRAGNHAAHPRRPILASLALDCLVQLFDVARWFHVQVDGAARADTGSFVAPRAEPDGAAKARDALERARLAEAKYEAVLKDLEEERKKRLATERTSESHTTDFAQIQHDGQQVASILQFDEARTRQRLIDTALTEAGWIVGADGKNTEMVRQEVRLGTLKASTSDGFADYVLYGDDGKPLAVIEAKRTSRDALAGLEQARLYANALEHETGVRPVVFCTNGVDIYLLDDARRYPSRKVYGFYSKDSLEYLIHRRTNQKAISLVEPNLAIADRMYQLEAIKRVSERFSNNFRKALLVLATGTGKTRVAVSLCDVLLRAGWARRVLFLCDRKELRRQADRTFKAFMPLEPRVIVNRTTASDRDKRIYLATYPAMMACFEDFDVGFFDLVIADESHRSIYNKFHALFLYFDALQVGLTATPVKYVERNTYALFGCEDKDPTAHFDFTDAVGSTPPYLVPFRVRDCKTWARTDGFSYQGMNDEQKRQLIAQTNDPTSVEFAPEDLNTLVLNSDTTRFVWRTLADEGIRDATGTRVGKTIVFARSHDHAMHMARVFSELYPQYGSTFCRVIDNQIERAEQLIDDLKDPKNELTIAISVDMLDTGIDVPEVVNLVFAKPVRSYTKFWQMIGRGTRLCKDLFGPGRDKKEFVIFDHWSNFKFFDEEYEEREPPRQKSLLQHLFEARIELAQAARDKKDERTFEAAVALILSDLSALRGADVIDVRDRWKELEKLSETERLRHFAAATRADLLSIAAPLQHHRGVRGEEDAYRFDLLMTRLEVELVKGGPGSGPVLALRARMNEAIDRLSPNQNPVKAEAGAIAQARDNAMWEKIEPHTVEGFRRDLRGIMKYQQARPTGRVAPLEFDVTDTKLSIETYVPKLEGLDLVAYRHRVEAVLRDHFASDSTLRRIRAGQVVREEELESLAKLILEVDDKANVSQLAGADPATRRSLLTVFRSLLGLDAAAVERAFTEFVHAHPRLSAQQLRFLQVLQNHIAQNGGIEIDRLYEAPFTTIHAESVDGVFPEPGDVDHILRILTVFDPRRAPSSDASSQGQAS